MPTTNIEIKLPLGIRKKFLLKSSYHYKALQSKFLQSNQITRNKTQTSTNDKRNRKKKS